MSLPRFIQGLRDRSGDEIFLSALIQRVIAFVTMMAVIKILPSSEYGYAAYAMSSLAFLLPLKGLGSDTGLLRYGSLTGSQREKKFMFRSSFRRGMIASAILYTIVFIAAPWMAKNLEESELYIRLFGLQFFSFYLFHMILAYARLYHMNRLFARLGILHASLLLVVVVPLCYFLGGIGYILGLVLVPLVIGLWFIISFRIVSTDRSESDRKQGLPAGFLWYSVYTSLSNVMALLLFAIDVIIIGNILADELLVARYKAASLLPFSALVIPVSVFTTDFVKLSRLAVSQPSEIMSYYRSYLKSFLPITIVVVAGLWYVGPLILGLLGEEYLAGTSILRVLSLGIFGAILFRVPLGNMLAAVGWSRANLAIAIVIILINIVCNTYAVRTYGVIGAAYVTAGLLWLSGFINLAVLQYWYRTRDAVES